MEVDPTLRVRILTGKEHHSGVVGGLPDAYAAAWRDLCDQAPLDTEVMVAGVGVTGKAPFHDRWMFSKSVGLRLGTSLNSLGVRDTEISLLGSGEVGNVQNAVERYFGKVVKEVDGERVRYESFELWN